MTNYTRDNFSAQKRMDALSQQLGRGVTPEELEGIDQEMSQISLWVTSEEKQLVIETCQTFNVPIPKMKIKPPTGKKGRGFSKN